MASARAAFGDEKGKKALLARIAGVLDEIRPVIRADGGNVVLEDVGPDGVVRVRLEGACVGCPSSTRTLQLGIEKSLRNRIPEVTGVVCEG